MMTKQVLLSIVLAIFAPTESFLVRSPHRPAAACVVSNRIWPMFAKASGQESSPFSLPPNEFSRTIEPDRIFKMKRDYNVHLEASESECQALADRFDLAEIRQLTADLSCRPELIGNNSNRGRITGGVEVEGTVTATVTQTCVRTNEGFTVQVEFPLYSIVRPVAPLFFQQSINDNQHQQFDEPKGRKSVKIDEQELKAMDSMELQKMVQIDWNEDDDDVLMEDEAIFVQDASTMDVGELVAQLFWLKLDPYPKKPGSDPVQASITG